MGRRKKMPLELKLNTQSLIRRWVRMHTECMDDYIVEEELARGQVVLQKLKRLVKIYEGQESLVRDMALTLLYDPHSIPEKDKGEE